MRRFASARRSRTFRSAGGTSLDAAILALSPYSFFAADNYTVDGVSGKVASFPDKVAAGTGIRAITAAHAMEQATSAQQVDVPTADATLANQLSATFTGTLRYASNSTAAAWKFLNDGTGFEVFHAYIPTTVAAGTYVMLATKAAGASNGFVFYRATAQYGFQIRTTVAAPITSQTGTAVANTAYYQSAQFIDDGGSPEWIHRLGNTTLGSGTATGISTADPAGPLRLGSFTDNSSGDQSRWACTIAFNRVLTAGDRSAVQAYILAKYGLAA